MGNQSKMKIQHFTWPISLNLSNKIDQNLIALQEIFKKKIFKNTWIIEAIKQKLNKSEKEFDTHVRQSFRIDEMTSLKLDEHVKKMRHQMKVYSKQKIILEAIQEKLSTEEEIVNQKIHEHHLLLNELRDRK